MMIIVKARFSVSRIILFFFVLFALNTSAQSYQDSLQMAVKLRESGNIKQAVNILSRIHKAHPTDLNINWYYAQSAYIAGDLPLSCWLYEAAIKIQPENVAIQLDYAKTLVNSGELDKAEWLLNDIVKKDVNKVEAWFYLGKVYYWQGRFSEAEKLLSNLVVKAPGKTDAASLLAQLRRDKAPWAQFFVSLNHDDQPLNILTLAEKGGWYHSSLLSLDFDLLSPMARVKGDNYFMQGLRVGNSMQFRKIHSKLHFSAGLFNNSKVNKAFFWGDIRLEKTVFKKMVLAISAQRDPYYFTRGSLDTALMVNHFAGSIEWSDPNKWNGKLNIEHNIFTSDQKSVTAFSGWFFAPRIQWGKWDFHFGYGYNYSNSDVNHYSSSKSVEDIVNSGELTSPVDGVYNPYFTPNEQQIHSILTTINAQLTPAFGIKASGNVGVYAKTLYPYLYLNQDSSGVYFMVKGYESTAFVPFEIKARFDLKLSQTLLFSTELEYFHTIYYSGEMVRLSLKKSF